MPAFLQLAAELLAHDAPDALVKRALDAAEDEIVHAQLCADLASRYLGARVWPMLPDIAAPLGRKLDMVQLAAESWLDGCLAEGAAAARAKEAARVASDPAAKIVQARIAGDEARHAELGWSILAWASTRGGPRVSEAVRALRDMEMAASPGERRELARYGRLGRAESDAADDCHWARCRKGLANALDASTRSVSRVA